MKPISQLATLWFLIWPCSLSAIEGLRLTVQCPDVELSWPSIPGETYIIQWCSSLALSNAWLTLTNGYPASSGTNSTTFLHPSQMECSSNLLTSQASVAYPVALADAILAGRATYETPLPPMPLVRTNGVWRSWEEVYGPLPPIICAISDRLRATVLQASAEGTLRLQDSVADSGGGSTDDPETNASPAAGFYRVVRNGLHLAGITNNMVLQGVCSFQAELGTEEPGTPQIRLMANGVTVSAHTVSMDSGCPVVTLDTP